ncbi:MAG: cohesin domain-containing protein [Candidatus Delongbacteria bacterium]
MRALLFSLTALLLGLRPGLAQTLELTVEPQVVEPDELITLELRVDTAVADLRGYTLDLHYDRDRVSVFSIYEGGLMLAHTPTFFYWEDSGANGNSVIHIDHAILGGTVGASGPGVLCTVVLRAEDCGIETVWVDNALFRDMENAPLAVGLGGGVEHQVCQVPPLQITRLTDGRMRLTWDRGLNVDEYHLWTRERWYQPWLYLATTTDTFWVDPGTPGPQMRLYRLTLLHH